MIILDTNVLSELMERRPSPAVIAWADAQRRDQLVTTSITVMELHAGTYLLKSGKRRKELVTSLDWVFDELLDGRILNFDGRAAVAAAKLYSERRSAGRSIDLRDTQIAAIATARRVSLATRNILHFNDLDIKVVNPWGSQPRV